MEQLTNQEKPTLVSVIAWMTLISGIVDLFWGLILSLHVSASFIGVICVPITILPTILGIFEVIYAAKLISTQPQAVRPSNTIAILEIICVLAGNAFSVVVGILALVFYNDQAVRDYFARINGTLVPAAPVTSPLPPEPAPAAPEEIAPIEDASPESAPEETPEKPKRSRKVSK